MLHTLTPADVEAVAVAVAARIQPDPLPRHLTVAQVAERLAVAPSWVYEHSADLGATRLGDGDRAPLRFSERDVVAYLDRRAASMPDAHGRDDDQPMALRRRRTPRQTGRAAA